MVFAFGLARLVPAIYAALAGDLFLSESPLSRGHQVISSFLKHGFSLKLP